MTLPVLYSFRRCPYAMRARLAITASGVCVELREIVLRNKPAEMLRASLKATVPVLVLGDQVIDESLDIMLWALEQHDPQNLLTHGAQALELVARCETEFKPHLDRFKYHVRYVGVDPKQEQQIAAQYLQELDRLLQKNQFLFGPRISLADIAIAPFVRQFANADRAWFDAQHWPALSNWLASFINGPSFQQVMSKYPPWQTGDPVTFFPRQAVNAS